MGGGRWDTDSYYDSASARKSRGIDDFDYSKKASVVHTNLDPKRINGKPFGKLESRDSVEHPNSNAIIVGFDVTGSNLARAIDAQKALPNLMNLLPKYIADPQIAVAANDDFLTTREFPVQISDFESDNRIDEHIRSIKLVGLGGGNDGESYDLLLYAAARKTVIDCFEKRNRKGYLFLYADEPVFQKVKKVEVAHVFGDDIQKDIPIKEIIAEVKEMYHLVVLWPVGGYEHAREQFYKLFGRDAVLILQHPNKICETIAAYIGVNEEKITSDEALKDLVSVGISPAIASSISQSLVPLSRSKAVTKLKGGLPTVGSVKKGGAARL